MSINDAVNNIGEIVIPIFGVIFILRVIYATITRNDEK